MPRPLMQSRIGDLEAMYAASMGQLEVLGQLEHELQFRQVPRALVLLDLVQRAKAVAGAVKGDRLVPAGPLKSAETTQRSGVVAPTQLSLLSTPVEAGAERMHVPVSDHLIPARVQAPSPSAPRMTPVVPPPSMSVDDACRHLKVAQGAPWELVEQARRRAVQPSSPLVQGGSDDQRNSALAAARLANAAYAVLAATRLQRS
jgi:hypothetical protein